jgi:hypothetical protein
MSKKIKPDDAYPCLPVEARSRPPRDTQQTQPIQFPACAEDFKLEIHFKNRANGILLKIFDTAPVYHLSHLFITYRTAYFFLQYSVYLCPLTCKHNVKTITFRLLYSFIAVLQPKYYYDFDHKIRW